MKEGNITDPPVTETSADSTVGGIETSSQSADLSDASPFCSTCARNQQKYMSALAEWMPSDDDPACSIYDQELPKFKRHLEEQYPQVCAKCEPRVQARISEAEYAAKSDHLRRMLDRSREARATRQARNRNWRSLLVFAGAIGFWGSVVGQLVWHLVCALETRESLQENVASSVLPEPLALCVNQAGKILHLPRNCAVDLAPYAGLSIAAGLCSFWWNPKLRLRVSGRRGRFVNLGEYYQIQLIIMVARCVSWAVLKDPSNGLRPDLLRALHSVMIPFMIIVSLGFICNTLLS